MFGAARQLSCPFADISQQNNPLIAGASLYVGVVMAKQNFFFSILGSCGRRYRIKTFIWNPRSCKRRYIPAPDSMLAVTNELQHETSKYHIKQNVMRVSDDPSSTFSTVFSNPQFVHLPEVAIIGLVHFVIGLVLSLSRCNQSILLQALRFTTSLLED